VLIPIYLLVYITAESGVTPDTFFVVSDKTKIILFSPTSNASEQDSYEYKQVFAQKSPPTTNKQIRDDFPKSDTFYLFALIEVALTQK
jgi:hypothetical protein